MRSKNRDIDLRREVENSRELEELASWIDTPKLVTVDYVIRCGVDVETNTRLDISYQLSTPTTQVSVETGRESIRDTLIAWACSDEEGEALVSGLARTLGVDRGDVDAEVRVQLARRLPESIEEIHDEALRVVMVTGCETDFATALVARVLLAHPEVSDEAVQSVLDHRCVAGVMGS
ncbi:MAG: hypothetical protein IT348_10470 [Candidatus Eisenbacteria bacterium]|nr:hypothetical protein [Candidatus Eisenbacteria bacterium]